MQFLSSMASGLLGSLGSSLLPKITQAGGGIISGLLNKGLGLLGGFLGQTNQASDKLQPKISDIDQQHNVISNIEPNISAPVISDLLGKFGQSIMTKVNDMFQNYQQQNQHQGMWRTQNGQLDERMNLEPQQYSGYNGYGEDPYKRRQISN